MVAVFDDQRARFFILFEDSVKQLNCIRLKRTYRGRDKLIHLKVYDVCVVNACKHLATSGPGILTTLICPSLSRQLTQIIGLLARKYHIIPARVV